MNRLPRSRFGLIFCNVVLVLLLITNPLLAQDNSQNQNPQPAEGGGGPALSYVIAALCLMLVMLIICAPSRKSHTYRSDED